jgi:hypothetical protein
LGSPQILLQHPTDRKIPDNLCLGIFHFPLPLLIEFDSQ